MTRDEVVKVLARIQLGDNRQVDRVVVEAWSQEIGDLEFTDALGAVVAHRRTSSAYLMPAHVREGARVAANHRERAQRIAEQAARRALPRPAITLDRDEFERLTQEAIEAERRRKAGA